MTKNDNKIVRTDGKGSTFEPIKLIKRKTTTASKPKKTTKKKG